MQSPPSSTKRPAAMNLLDIPEDNMMSIINPLDVVSFILLMSTCKTLFNMRRTYMLYASEILNSYREYDNASYIPMLLNSYVNLDCIRQKKCKILDEIPQKLNVEKVKNTMNIVAYYQLCNPALFINFTYETSLLIMCCKTVCQKNHYLYKNPIDNLPMIFWHTWQKSAVNVLDLCEIAFHLKHKKYRELCALLSNLKFRMPNITRVYDTIDFISKYMSYGSTNETKAIMACVMYMYIQFHIKTLLNTPKFDKTIRENFVAQKKDLIKNIEDLKKFPIYLRTFLTTTIENSADMLRQNI